jgi:hypothetical protein
MDYEKIFYPHLTFILIALIASVYRWSVLRLPDKIISILLITTFISESISLYLTIHIKNNMYALHVFSPIQFALIALYYNYCIPFLRKRGLGIAIAVLGIVVGVLSTLFLQPAGTFPSFFLLFEGFWIIILSLLSFYSILYEEDYIIAKNTQFWISFLFLIFWAFTFFVWGSYISFIQVLKDKLSLIAGMIAGINFIFYPSLFVIFLFYRKMIPSGD